MTSLAGMAFLANGNTPSRGPYAENVHRAMIYVMDQAQQQSGLIASSAEYRGGGPVIAQFPGGFGNRGFDANIFGN